MCKIILCKKSNLEFIDQFSMDQELVTNIENHGEKDIDILFLNKFIATCLDRKYRTELILNYIDALIHNVLILTRKYDYDILVSQKNERDSKNPFKVLINEIKKVFRGEIIK